MYQSLFTYSLVEEYLGLQLVAIMNTVARNIHLNGFVHKFLFLLAKNLEVELLGELICKTINIIHHNNNLVII